MKMGEIALLEAACLVLSSLERRKRLVQAGWVRVTDPPLVSNQWIWWHPRWFVQLEGEAVRILDAESRGD
jgi:hypothetical protein